MQTAGVHYNGYETFRFSHRKRKGVAVAKESKQCKLEMAALAAAAALCAARLADAQTDWQVSTGDWAVSTNWTLGEPTSSDTAYINNGGTAQIAEGDVAENLTLGELAGQSGDLNMTAGSLTVPDTEDVGDGGDGSFVQSAGTNFTGTLSLGATNGASGSYELDNGNLNVNGAEFIGHISGPLAGTAGSGTFTQSGGVNLVQTLYIAGELDDKGKYDLSGGTLDAGTVVFANSGTFTQTGGTFSWTTIDQTSGELIAGHTDGPLPNPLTLGNGGSGFNYILGGGTLNCPTLNVNSGGSLKISGGLLSCDNLSLSGSGICTATTSGGLLGGNAHIVGLFSNSGDLSLQYAIDNARPLPTDDVPTELSITGDYTQGAGGELDIEIGTSPEDGALDNLVSSELKVSGTATLSGTLDISTDSADTFTPGESFTFLTADSVVGAFSTSNVAPPFYLAYTPTSVLVTYMPEPGAFGLLAGLALTGMIRRPKRKS